MKETLILVDDKDNPIGFASREECHQGNGKRHRAFVVFLFDDEGRVLLQFRSKDKLGGQRWDVTATSHVRKDETYDTAAERCLKHELGISVPLQKSGSFTYTEAYEEYSENEYCAVLIGKFNGKVIPNKEEMDRVNYSALDEIKKDVAENPEAYTKWFRGAFPIFCDFIKKSGYTR
ncbi:MAG: NUDIX domain-containing protein [Candidatus Aenigmarchaeota archaeon]|nr:NUDIX domain-containing protein [Candidatus Aenigmarchaeota archaeon]